MTEAAVAGVDVGGTHVRALGLDADGEVVARATDATPADDLDAALASIAGAVREVARGGAGRRRRRRPRRRPTGCCGRART